MGSSRAIFGARLCGQKFRSRRRGFRAVRGLFLGSEMDPVRQNTPFRVAIYCGLNPSAVCLRCSQGEAMEKTLAWAEGELEGFKICQEQTPQKLQTRREQVPFAWQTLQFMRSALGEF